MSAIAYYLLSRALIKLNGKESLLAAAVGKDLKGIISIIVYVIAVPFSFIASFISYALYILVAIMWVIPDKRIEKNISGNKIK